MQRALCIHGHFYQPPREDPWLCEVLPEGSAGPGLNWNERIGRESYGPLAWARRMDGEGRITEIINTYEWISFNFGPTLLSWMERGAPETYARVLEGDRKSLERWGHGNAMAQVCHHVIMPLASQRDKEVETAWGLADFEARFGRKAEGMWLAEAAVDTASLEVLASFGVRYVVLAPRQARAVAPLDGGQWTDVDEGNLDVTRAYRLELPSGRSMAAFFYHGGLSQAVAFERLLENGESFWNRIRGFFESRGSSRPVLLPMATDGETYGHHFMFGEMALAYVLSQTFFGRDQIELCNFGLWLERMPPTMKAELHEPSSWSCVHGVERWRSDCGCSTGGHPGFNQKWRRPLREALDGLKAALDDHYNARGAALFNDPDTALLEYGAVLAGSLEQKRFAARHCRKGLSAEERQVCMRLLAMQQWGIAAFASCAWFFDELSRIEPLNALSCAVRAMQLCEASGGPALDTLEAALLEKLDEARSNFPELGTGRDLYVNMVRPRLETPASLAAQALLALEFQGGVPGRRREMVAWNGVRVGVRTESRQGDPERLEGDMEVFWSLEHKEDVYRWRWQKASGGDPLQGRFQVAAEGEDLDAAPALSALELPWNKLQSLALTLAASAEQSQWRQLEERFQAGAQLFLPYQESQQTQNSEELWIRLWPSLAWQWALGLRLPQQDEPGGVRHGSQESLRSFIAGQAKGHPDGPMLARRVVEHVFELLSGDTPLWQSAAGVVQRVGEVGLEVDWWPVQNLLWAQGAPASASSGARRLASLLGFAA